MGRFRGGSTILHGNCIAACSAALKVTSRRLEQSLKTGFLAGPRRLRSYRVFASKVRASRGGFGNGILPAVWKIGKILGLFVIRLFDSQYSKRRVFHIIIDGTCVCGMINGCDYYK